MIKKYKLCKPTKCDIPSNKNSGLIDANSSIQKYLKFCKWSERKKGAVLQHLFELNKKQ